jgi:hypothetical protein
MMSKEIEVVSEGDLVVPQEILREAGMGRRLRLIIQKGEIRIHADPPPGPEESLNELSGCLGHEPATDYDFSLKIGGLYEAR